MEISKGESEAVTFAQAEQQLKEWQGSFDKFAPPTELQHDFNTIRDNVQHMLEAGEGGFSVKMFYILREDTNQMFEKLEGSYSGQK